MTKLKHFDDLGTVRFVTFGCHQRRPFLLSDDVKQVFIDHLGAARAKYEFGLFGYVIMPEHVHLVMLPAENTKLGLLIREIKSRFAREYFSNPPGGMRNGPHIFWLRRCYDHNCRTPETIKEKIRYCHMNPVKRGLVKTPGDYFWSSYNWYVGRRDVPLEIDELIM
jgi:putative transposase